MYRLSRLLLILGVCSCFCCIAMFVVLGWPWAGLIVSFLAFAKTVRGRRTRLTTLGSAEWASEHHLRRAGMVGADAGLILGRTTFKHGVSDGIRGLFRWRMKAADACRGFWAGLGRGRGEVVRLRNAVHTAVFGPTGGGKGVSCVIPFLLTCSESCVVVDFKGENAARTVAYRKRAFGHRIVLLDPFGVTGLKADTFNPLDFIDKDDPLALDECNALANALVIRNPDEREPHWNDSAEAWAAAMLATVVQYGSTGDRSLQTVRDLLSHPRRLEMANDLMCKSEVWRGMLSRMGGQLRHYVERERGSVLTTVSRHLRFLDTLAVATSTESSSFNPAELRDGKMTCYLILPPEHMRTQSALLRVWIGALLRAVVRGGLDERRKVHFILDEAASLGRMEAIDDAIDKYRGYGIRLQFYFQSLGQLKKCFPDGQDQTLLSNSSQIYFGVNDNVTAEYVSARLGEETIIVDSGGTNTGYSRQDTSAAQPQTSVGSSGGSSSNWQQQARKLLKPEEVMALPPRTAITFTPGLPPILHNASALLRG